MTTKRSVKLIKNDDRKDGSTKTPAEAFGPNKWSKAVRGWVGEFQDRQEDETLPAFDSLFKDRQ